MVVGDIADSADRDFSASSSGSGHQINIDVVDWSIKTVYLRAAISCTTSPNEFPYNPPNCIDCKATDVLGPRWTPREGGSGPHYRRM